MGHRGKANHMTVIPLPASFRLCRRPMKSVTSPTASRSTRLPSAPAAMRPAPKTTQGSWARAIHHERASITSTVTVTRTIRLNVVPPDSRPNMVPSLYRGRSARNGKGSNPSGEGSEARTQPFVPKSSTRAATEIAAVTILAGRRRLMMASGFAFVLKTLLSADNRTPTIYVRVRTKNQRNHGALAQACTNINVAGRAGRPNHSEWPQRQRQPAPLHC